MNHLTTYCVTRGCDRADCREHYRKIKREYARRHTAEGPVPTYLGFKEDSLAALLIDILETWTGEWWSSETLWFEVCRHRGDVLPSTVGKAFHRLIESGVVESRLVAVGFEVLQPSNKRGVRMLSTSVGMRRQIRRTSRAYLCEEAV